MLHKQKSLARLLTASLAIAAIAPATAGAVPIIDAQTVHVVKGQAVAAGGGPGVTPQTLTAPAQTQDLRAPDQVDGGFKPTQTSPNMPTWPVNPQPIAGHAGQATATKPADDGLSTWAIVLIAVGGVVVVATAGLGLARRKRVKTA